MILKQVFWMKFCTTHYIKRPFPAFFIPLRTAELPLWIATSIMSERLHVSKFNQKEFLFFSSPTDRSCDVTDGTPWSFPLSKSIQYITSISKSNPAGMYYYSDKWWSLCYRNHSLVTSCDNIFASKNRQCCVHLCSKGSQLCTFAHTTRRVYVCGGVVGGCVYVCFFFFNSKFAFIKSWVPFH